MKAVRPYTPEAARHYRECDEGVNQRPVGQQIGTLLGDLCESFGRPITVLDLGCGTGRYFWWLRNVVHLVGLDCSPSMLEHAQAPVEADRITAERVTLVAGDLQSHEFAAGAFDFVYSIGVLAEHAPLDEGLARRVSRWLKPGGLFAFTTVDPGSASVPLTAKRRVARAVAPFAPGPVRRKLRERLLSGGFYADAERVRAVLAPCGFTIERLEPFTSEVHLHCLCVARAS